MRHDVSDREIIGKKQVFETEGRQENQATCGHSGLPRTFYQQRVASYDGCDAACEGINGAYKS
jgi:hypothetical protein